MSQQEIDNRPYSAHVQMTVATALAMTDRDLIEWFGEPLSEVKAELEELKKSGRIYLHTEGCDNEDPITGKCLKHYENETK